MIVELLSESKNILENIKQLVLIAERISYSPLDDDVKRQMHEEIRVSILEHVGKLTFRTKG